MMGVRVLCAAQGLLLAGVMGAGAVRSGPPSEAVLFAPNVMIPMRDGVRLAADVYRPATNGVPLDE
ncbi:MAG: hypothetical protein FJW35_12240, partial [Acidobacteria bacterium]|nr:hypothetical protein [Acidobacteriota bacterium]